MNEKKSQRTAENCGAQTMKPKQMNNQSKTSKIILKIMIQKLILFAVVMLCIIQSYAQTGSIFNNGAQIVSTSGNYWIVNNGNFTLTSESPVNLAKLANLIIGNNSSLALTPTTCLTVNELLTNNQSAGTNGVIVHSTAAGTSSLIAGSATGIGSAEAERWIAAGKWNIISSPLSGQTVSGFLTNNSRIASKDVSGVTVRGILDYDPVANSWSTPSASGPTGNLGGGKGFSMRLQGTNPPADNAAVTFHGSLQTGDQTMTNLVKGKWNSVGNPYTSAMGITENSAVGSASFLSVNASSGNSNIDPAYGYIYVWSDGDASNGQNGHYKMIGNLSMDFTADYDIQQGQAFMVKMNTNATSLVFNRAMQLHAPNLTFKSAGVPWPAILVKTAAGNLVSSTMIAFNSNMTKGLDPNYDAGILKGTSDLVIYTRLVEDNGIPFAIQALPDNELNAMIIPVGLDFKTGGEVVFSSELLNLPANCKVILEDKLTKTFTDLSKDEYRVTIPENSVINDRFQLHAGDIISEINDVIAANQFIAYAVPNIGIRIEGEVSNHARATLFDVLGRVVLLKNLSEGNLNILQTPNLKPGLYLLTVIDTKGMHTFKILAGL